MTTTDRANTIAGARTTARAEYAERAEAHGYFHYATDDAIRTCPACGATYRADSDDPRDWHDIWYRAAGTVDCKRTRAGNK